MERYFWDYVNILLPVIFWPANFSIHRWCFLETITTVVLAVDDGPFPSFLLCLLTGGHSKKVSPISSIDLFIYSAIYSYWYNLWIVFYSVDYNCLLSFLTLLPTLPKILKPIKLACVISITPWYFESFLTCWCPLFMLYFLLQSYHQPSL